MDAETLTGPSPVAPPFLDDAGYSVTHADLAFVGVSRSDLLAMRSGQYPLGMDSQKYAEFVTTLWCALRDEGALNAEVRLQGSSAKFFSGSHKPMLWSRDELEDEFNKNGSGAKPASSYLLSRFEEQLSTQWPNSTKRPKARPFDVMHRLGVHEYPSDYDVQISSDELFNKVRVQIRDRRITPDQFRVQSATYAYVNKEYASRLAYLSVWQGEVSSIVGRPVTVALFDQSGPPKVSEEEGQISSHHKPDDWRIPRIIFDGPDQQKY